MGLIEDAVKEYDELIERDPNNSSYWIDRGTLVWQLEPEQALEDFSTAIELSAHPLAYNNRANYYRSIGELDKALEDAKQALNLDPDLGIIYASLAEIYADRDEEASFFEYFSLALIYYYEDLVDAMSEPAFQKYASSPKFQAALEAAKEAKRSQSSTDNN